jgi:hypothetical protein
MKWIGCKSVKRRLEREPYFRDLMSKNPSNRDRFTAEWRRVAGSELRVVEMCGEPGDVVLMDMRVLHAPAPNALRVPRIMITQRFMPEALRSVIYGHRSPDEQDGGGPEAEPSAAPDPART